MHELYARNQELHEEVRHLTEELEENRSKNYHEKLSETLHQLSEYKEERDRQAELVENIIR